MPSNPLDDQRMKELIDRLPPGLLKEYLINPAARQALFASTLAQVSGQIAAGAFGRPDAVSRETYLNSLVDVGASVERLEYGSRVTGRIRDSHWVPGALEMIITAEGVDGEACVLYVHPDWRSGMYRDARPLQFEILISSTRNGQRQVVATSASEKADDIAAVVDAWLRSDAGPGLSPKPFEACDLDGLRNMARTVEPLLDRQDDGSSLVVLPESAETLAAGLEGEELAACLADIAAIDTRRIAIFAPRDEKGRLALGVQLLLARYPSAPEGTPSRKGIWLVATGPGKRRDPQQFTIGVREVYADPYPHRWNSARWLWDRNLASAPEAVRWGVEGLDLARLGMEGRQANLEYMRQAATSAEATVADRAGLSILLQDEGRIDEACSLFHIELSPEARDVLRGRWVWPGSPQIAEPWAECLGAGLRAAALWRFGPVVEEVRRAAVTVGKTSRKKKQVRLRLFALPHQTQVAKLAVMLVGSGEPGSGTRIEIEATGWDFRFPEALWKRPLDLEMARFRLAPRNF